MFYSIGIYEKEELNVKGDIAEIVENTVDVYVNSVKKDVEVGRIYKQDKCTISIEDGGTCIKKGDYLKVVYNTTLEQFQRGKKIKSISKKTVDFYKKGVVLCSIVQ